MSKFFLLDPKRRSSSKEVTNLIQQEGEQILQGIDNIVTIKKTSQLLEEDNLVHVDNRIVVKVDMKSKDSHTFASGLVIRRERNFNNFNRRETQPVNCIVISGDGIPKDAEILVDHNAFHETNRVNDYKNSFESEDSEIVRYYSLARYECFAWRTGESDWVPLYPFQFGLRVFQPYKGLLDGIEPQPLKDTLYVLSGDLKGTVVKTVKAADYVIIFQERTGREGSLLVFRPNGDEKRKLEEEAIAILHSETKKVISGELLIGFTIQDAKQLKDIVSNN